MPSLISAIRIPDDSYVFQSTDCQETIFNLSKINIFLGENNSGKSRLLRRIVSNDITYKHSDVKFELLNDFISKIKTEFGEYFKRAGLSNFSYTNKVLSELNYTEYINDSYNVLSKLEELRNIIISLEKNTDTSTNYISHKNIGKALKEIFVRNLPLIDKSLTFEQDLTTQLEVPSFTKHYIPILRGMRPLAEKEDLYHLRTVKDYFSGTDSLPFELFTGINSYQQIKESLLGNLTNRRLVKEYEEYLAGTFFEGKPIALIPSINSDVLTIKIGDEKEQPIYNLGDGIQTIIILTLPLFLNKGKNLLIFIEEPEIYLHPALQRKLLETLLKHDGFENYQYFITTHSNHFLDLTMDYSDISIYSLRKYFDEGEHEEKNAKYIIENLSYGDTSALELLGVRNSSVFLSNCTIWVEGITDRLYFRHYLEKYMEHLRDTSSDSYKELREDYHYSFVEYGGGNITHWSFLQELDGETTINVGRLCGKLFLIADGDNDATSKKPRHQKLSDKLGDRFYLLRCREVENLLSKDILGKVISDYEGVAYTPDFVEEDYKDKYLGEFIEEKLGSSKKRRGSYKSDSGTIKDKPTFCKKALGYIEDWNNLSDEAKQISEKMYQFILQNNTNGQLLNEANVEEETQNKGTE